MQAREPWQETFAQIRQMHAWVLQVEAIFDGSWANTPEEVTQTAVATRFDAWLAGLEAQVSILAQETPMALGLGELARVLRHLQPHLLHCYDVEGLPRTNNGPRTLYPSHQNTLSAHLWPSELEYVPLALWK